MSAPLRLLLLATVLIASPALAGSSRSGSHHSTSTHKKCSTCARDSHGKIKRSPKAKAAFEHANPCPATHKTTGACPGYVIDHKVPLECGGTDTPANMQWQSVADAKAKDKTESRCR